jgi:hypothetical protein
MQKQQVVRNTLGSAKFTGKGIPPRGTSLRQHKSTSKNKIVKVNNNITHALSNSAGDFSK